MSDVPVANTGMVLDFGLRRPALQTTCLLVYVLYLGAAFTGVSLIAGAMLAHSSRAHARGTVFEGHFDHAIEMFWIALIGTAVLLPLAFLFGLGLFLEAALAAWLVMRTVDGLARALRHEPCARVAAGR
ncbi:MAG TPA: hypothetical protein VGF97_10145 [Rhizomicrobium sp.]|jgi:uncharacterized membrane protein